MRAACWFGIALLTAPVVAGSADSDSPWFFQIYGDIGYVASDNAPANMEWRTKSTTSTLDDLSLFLGMGDVGKHATSESRWGFEFGLQTGLDSEGLVPAPPPPALAAVDDADTLRYLYRANASYLFDAGRGVRLTVGLLNSYIGYEWYLAIENPNYTRGYILDYVPYFLVGGEIAWDVSEDVDLSFYVVTGMSYLSNPNDAPAYGLQLKWKISSRTTLTQNLYYGPDQADTRVEYWRFFSDTIVQWKTGRFLLAGAVDFGLERQAALPGQPRYRWGSAALWARWQLSERWSAAFRPEVYWDPDGISTAARQTIQAYTATVKYQFSPRRHRLVGSLEARFDRSTGDEGGFFEGANNALVPDQSLLLASVNWSWDGGF